MRDILCMYYSRTGATRQAMTEIAQALEVSEACVRQRLHRGRKRFQTAYLEKEELCHEK